MSIMNHECPHCYVNLKLHGTRARLVTVNHKKAVYPCCPYCKTILDIDLPPLAKKVSFASLIGLAILLSQSVRWFESLGYANQDAWLFSALLLIVLSYTAVKVLRRMIPAQWMIWRKVARPVYRLPEGVSEG
jgi:hypothetical protein